MHHKILFIFSPFVPEVHGQNKEITVNLASAKTQISPLPTQARSGYMFFISFPLSSRTINRIQGGGVMGRRSYCSLGGRQRDQRERTHLITETCQKRVSNCQNSMAEWAIYRTCELEPAVAQLPAHKYCLACLGGQTAVHDF